MASTPADVMEYPNLYVFVIDMPGLKSGDIKVDVEDDNVLVISGERKREEEKEGAKYLRMETMVGNFTRKFVLPDNANTEVVSAVCQDGVLSVTVETLPPPQPQPKKPITLEDNYRFLSSCIKKLLGFKKGKPVAACIIYKCLHQQQAFESDYTAILKYIIEGINDVLKVSKEGIVWPYWLSNTSALLRLLHSNGYDNGMSNVEARYPVLLFKQLLTACVEKIFVHLRDNLKEELSQLLQLSIKTAKTVRVQSGKSSGFLWSSIVILLDSFLIKLRRNHVPSFFIRKLINQVFSFINITLFNSLLLHPECCTFTYGEYMKSGLAELDKWMANAKEYAGTSWLELNHTRQVVEFLETTHQKEKISLEEIKAFTVTQIHQICSTYLDDKYGTQSVFNEAVSIMRAIETAKVFSYMPSNSFLLRDDLSIPFSAEDVVTAFPPIDLDDIDVPLFV